MIKKTVSEDLCKERSGNIEGKVDKTIEKVDNLIDKVDHMKGNCLATIKGKLVTLETHHHYTTQSLNEIKKLLQPKEKTKVDKETVILALKIIVGMTIILYLVISGNAEKGINFGVDISKDIVTGLIGD